MNQRIPQTFALLVLMMFMTACQNRSTSAARTPNLPLSPSPSATQTSEPIHVPTAPVTPAQISSPPPIVSPITVDQNAFAVAFSADGLFLAFNSSIDELVPEDQNHTTDPWIYQTDNASIQWIRTAKEDPFRKSTPSLAASLSANGRYLLFGGRSNGLEPIENHYNDIFLRDLKTGQEERIDFTPLETQQSVTSINAILSPDGRYLALEATSFSSNIFLLERSTGKITPVTRFPDGRQPDGTSFNAVFSPDGKYLAFVSDASGLVAGDIPCSEGNPYCGDIFVYDIVTEKIERIPAHLQFTLGNPFPYLTVSNDARWLAWTEVVHPSPAFHPVIRLFDRATGKTETVCSGKEPSCSGHSPSISADGRWLAFSTVAEFDSNGQRLPGAFSQVFLLDHQTGQGSLVSTDSFGHPGNGESGIISLQQEGFSSDVRISGDGRYVAFSSQATNLLPAGITKRQCNDPVIVGEYLCYDLFLFDQQTRKLSWISRQK